MRKALFIASVAAALWLAPGALAAGWCGTGESAIDRPDVVAGAQVHAIVATPSDSPDLFAADANKLADDVASISAWWTGQDPTRVPRYDMATFPGGTCLDISFVRLPLPASSYQGASNAFNAVRKELRGVGFANAYKDYVVYYDGPSVEGGICGTGAGGFDQGDAFAVVWLNGCLGVAIDGVQAHELLHAFGALPTGAPHACTPATDPFGVFDLGHPCDSPNDVLYPETDNTPLQLKVLDVNHDDYYAHSGSWIDIQDAIFLHRLDVAQVPLSIALAGSGTVVSDVPGVECTAACTTQWDPGTAVTLRVTPADGSRLVRWTGGCVGPNECQLSLPQATSVTAVFGPATIPVTVSTTGKGAVKCSPACSKRFSAGTALTLRAAAAKGWKFVRWSGACTGTRLTCSPKTDYAVTVRLTFKKLPVVKKKS